MVKKGFEKVTALLKIKLRNEPSSYIIETKDEFYAIDQITILENMEEVIGDNEDLIEIIYEIDKNKKKIDISKHLNLSSNNYIQTIKQTMYETCVLNPQFKKLRFTSETIKIQIYEEFCNIYNKEKENQMANESESFFVLSLRSIFKPVSDTKTIDNNDNDYEKRKNRS
ncbi:5226_t:CDS:2 [Funneliformis geosporum]|nr:5226_t:CDS:2 [Funneliformis geosporum]